MPEEITHRLNDLQRPSKELPRKFVPQQVDFSSWDKLEPLFQNLIDRKLDSVAAVEQFLLDQSELGAVISEEGSRRYIAMTCATNNEELEKAFLHFVENIEPRLKPIDNQLDHKLVDCPHTASLDERRYGVMLRSIRNQIELFRQENVALETEIDKLSQQYQKVMGGIMIDFRGEERTMQQMGIFGQDTDRGTRQEAFMATNERFQRETDKLDEIFDQMLKLRRQIAANAGFANYRDYMFRRKDRFDYTPEHCFAYHDAVEKFVVPVSRAAVQDRKASLKLDTVRPWDTACDRYGRTPLRPFTDTPQLAQGCREIFGKVDPRLGDQFQKMMDLGLLDLASRKGKAPGGYQSSLSEVRLPFIFMNAVGLNRDVYTLLHEGGHAFHQFATHDEPLLGYRHTGAEFAEVASMSMEKLGSPYLDVFYSKGDAARAFRDSLESDIGIMPWIAVVDAFQHWIYTHPDHTVEQRSDRFVELLDRFGAGVDWSGLESFKRKRWQVQLHIFEYPFYYIEYGIALLGALQIWQNAQTDARGAIDAYLAALQLGGSRPLPKLFETAGARFDFTADTIKPLMAKVQEEMEVQGSMESKE